MKTRFFLEADDWTTDGAKITAPETLQSIQKTLEEAPIVIEHWFYRGSSAPDRIIFDDFDDFMEYLNCKASAGDKIYIWNFSTTCNDKNRLASGKCPDDNGRTPKKGAY
ncbi:MAG TPA: hypothetical protein VLK33_12250 [Terriglobales bacterium]|nr:hypothetical protein [Terriglobales bacterium]